MGNITFKILGCGSSGGVPRLGGVWGACDPTNPKDERFIRAPIHKWRRGNY